MGDKMKSCRRGYLRVKEKCISEKEFKKKVLNNATRQHSKGLIEGRTEYGKSKNLKDFDKIRFKPQFQDFSDTLIEETIKALFVKRRFGR